MADEHEQIFKALDRIEVKLDKHTEVHTVIEGRLASVEEKTAELSWWKTTVLGALICSAIAALGVFWHK